MNRFSTLALTASLGVALIAPAAAKDKPAPAGPRLTPAFVKAAGPAQAAVNAGDTATAEPLVAAVEAVATTDDERLLSTQMRLVLESKKLTAATTANPSAVVSQTPLVKPLDALIANPLTPAADRSRYYLIRARMAYQGKQYPVAIDYGQKARDGGNTDPDLTAFLIRAKFDSGDVAGGTAELDRAIAEGAAKGQTAPVDWYKLAIAQANRRHLAPLTVAWMGKYAAAYPSGQTWYDVVTSYGLQHDAAATLDNPQKVDLYRLMRASGGLGDQYGYLDYARNAQSAGLPLEAQAVLKEGLASGKIQTGSADVKAIQAQLTKTAGKGTLAAMETKANAATNGLLAAQAGDAQLGSGNYAKAVALYRTALTKGGVDADAVNTHLGIALARSGDKPGAQAAFASVKGSPRSDIAALWTTWLTTGPTAS